MDFGLDGMRALYIKRNKKGTGFKTCPLLRQTLLGAWHLNLGHALFQRAKVFSCNILASQPKRQGQSKHDTSNKDGIMSAKER